ncbi:hypothetical protein TNCV_4948971 [Trichonephila clavipes]|nr:hypothetical protein TNCV_4948971 [Trichonephila clavipes]
MALLTSSTYEFSFPQEAEFAAKRLQHVLTWEQARTRYGRARIPAALGIHEKPDAMCNINPPTGQHRFFRPTREASKTDHTEFFVRPVTHQNEPNGFFLPQPDGHGYELVSSVRALVPQKFSVEEELMHVKHVEVKSPHVGVMWNFGRGVISSGIVLVT